MKDTENIYIPPTITIPTLPEVPTVNDLGKIIPGPYDRNFNTHRNI